jgi:hypothetical protein
MKDELMEAFSEIKPEFFMSRYKIQATESIFINEIHDGEISF